MVETGILSGSPLLSSPFLSSSTAIVLSLDTELSALTSGKSLAIEIDSVMVRNWELTNRADGAVDWSIVGETLAVNIESLSGSEEGNGRKGNRLEHSYFEIYYNFVGNKRNLSIKDLAVILPKSN